MFQFKQFSVDQTGCAMKINTDGVLLGALTEANDPGNILDIGTGTGVIALMLAQRFSSAIIDAVEIDEAASQTAGRNFENSPFSNRLNISPLPIQSFFNKYPEKKYDLIVSNPPFHLNSLESPKAGKSLAKHTDGDFFEDLISGVAKHLTNDGACWLILPLQAAELVNDVAGRNGLYLQKKINIHSFEGSEPHREIVVFGKESKEVIEDKFVIYNEPKIYSEMYINSLKDFFTIF
jgi:tRNA1Val (adenine37-N6)-methyltransferase